MANKTRLKNLKQVALYLTPQAHAALRALSARTRVPATAYLREAVDDVLAKYPDSVDALLPPVRLSRKRRSKL